MKQSHELLHRSQPAASATRIGFCPPCRGEAAPARQQLTAPPDYKWYGGDTGPAAITWATGAQNRRGQRLDNRAAGMRASSRVGSSGVDRAFYQERPRVASDNHGVASETRNWACLSTAGRSGTHPTLQNRPYPRDFAGTASRLPPA